jgi:hypothetical protein
MKKTYKLNKNELFATPESPECLLEYASRFSGSEKIVAMTLMGMTWNLCAEITKDSEKKMIERPICIKRNSEHD